MEAGRPLAVPRRPRTTLAAWTVVVALLAGLVFWFVSSPPRLPTSRDPVLASAPVGQDVYLAVVDGVPDRTLRLSGIMVRVVSQAPVDVEPMLCVDGSPRVTTDPTAFCRRLVAPDGESFGPDDTVVLRVRGEYAGSVLVSRLHLRYRDGIRFGTQPAGSPAQITILGR